MEAKKKSNNIFPAYLENCQILIVCFLCVPFAVQSMLLEWPLWV